MMIKLFFQIKKNFKRLASSKIAASLIIFGPLLMISLLGLAFQSDSLHNISIAIHDKGDGSLSKEIVEILEYNDFRVTRGEEDSCKRGVLTGDEHICIIFPSSYEEGDVEFYVDYSRMNLVYNLLNILRSELNRLSEDIGLDITEDLLTSISQTQIMLSRGVSNIEEFDESLTTIIERINTIQNTVSATPAIESELLRQLADEDSDINLDIARASSELETLKYELENNREVALEFKQVLETSESSLENTLSNNCAGLQYEDLTEELESGDDVWQVSELHLCSITYTLLQNIRLRKDYVEDNIEQIDNIENRIITTQDNVNTYQRFMQDESRTAESGIEELEAGRTELTESFSLLNEELMNSRSFLIDTSEGFRSALSDFEEYAFLDAQNIITPLTTAVKSIDDMDRNYLDFLFPGLVVMIIMFVGILLGNILVIKEKTSSAYFRNLIMPLSSWYSLIGIYFTSVVIVFLQVGVLFIVGIQVFNSNILISPQALMVILITSIIFISMGMFIGFLSNSAEISILISISASIIFMMLSNLIFPMETMNQYVVMFANYTPFNISEVFLRRYLIYGPEMASVGWFYLTILTLTLVVFVLLVYGSQKLSAKR